MFGECLRYLFTQNWSPQHLRQAEEKRAALGVSEQPFVPWARPNSKMVQLPQPKQPKRKYALLPYIHLHTSYPFSSLSESVCSVHFVISPSRWHGTEVVIVGGSQCGLALAARLQRLGVSYIVVDQNQRPGDSWRKRHMAWWTRVEGGGFGWNSVKGVAKWWCWWWEILLIWVLEVVCLAARYLAGCMVQETAQCHLYTNVVQVLGWIPRLWLPPLARPCFRQSFAAFSHPGPLALVAAQRSDGRLVRCLARIISHPPEEMVCSKLKHERNQEECSSSPSQHTFSSFCLVFVSPKWWLVKIHSDWPQTSILSPQRGSCFIFGIQTSQPFLFIAPQKRWP